MAELGQVEIKGGTKGINIQDALGILSSRAANPGEDKALLEAATPELKQLGQTLDLMNSQKWTRFGKDDCCDENEVDNIDNATSKMISRQENGQGGKPFSNVENVAETGHDLKLLKQLSTMSQAELLSKLFELQQSRVSIYRDLNKGLDVILQSGNLTSYPGLISTVTASFAVISNSIKAIQSVLDSEAEKSNNKDRNDVVAFIQQLQMLEKEKLNLTAALHLEKIREKNQILHLTGMNAETSRSSLDDDNMKYEKNDATLQLLRQGVSELQRKITRCVEMINDVLEELRYSSEFT